MNPLEIFLIGAVAVTSISWQFRIIKKEYYGIDYFEDYFWSDMPKRAKRAFYLGASAFWGCILYSGFSIFSDRPESISNIDAGLMLSLKAFVFWLVAIIKSYVSCIIAGFILAFTIYNLFEYNDFEVIPIFDALIKWLFSTTSKTVHWVYVSIWFVYSFGSSVIASFKD